MVRLPATPCYIGGKPSQCLDRWDEVIGTTDRRRISGQGVTYAVLCSRHTSEHAGQAMLVAAEADKHRPVLSGRPERGIAAEDMLFYHHSLRYRARDMALGTAYLFSPARYSSLGPSDDLLLAPQIGSASKAAASCIHLLHQDHAPACTRDPSANECHLRCLGEMRILGPSMEPVKSRLSL